MTSFEMNLIEAAPHVGMFAFNEYYVYKMMRGVLHRTTGFAPEVSEGKNLYQLIPESEWTILEGYYDRALNGETFSVKYSSPIDGATYHVDFFPVKHEGKQYGAGLVRDITGVIDAEKLLNIERNKADLSELIGKYYLSVSELLINLAGDKDLSCVAREKARRVFSKTIGLQKLAGNIIYDFGQFKLDDLIRDAHKKAKSLISLDLNGGVSRADRTSFIQAITDILNNIKSEGLLKTIGLNIEITFNPPDSIDDFNFDVAISVMIAHGYEFNKGFKNGFITYQFIKE